MGTWSQFSGSSATSGVTPGGAAGGDLSGTYPNPGVAKVNGAALPASKAYVGTNSSSQIIDATATPLVAAQMPALTGDVTNTVGTLATTVGRINGTAFAGTNGDVVSFGAANIPADSGVVAANLVVASAPGAGIARFAGSTQTATSAELSGDVTTSGSNAATVIRINGASVPLTKSFLGSNGSGQLTDASATVVAAAQLPAATSATAGAVKIGVAHFLNTASSTTGTASTQNNATVYSFYIPYHITVSNISVYCAVVDNSSNTYDIMGFGPGAVGSTSVNKAFNTGSLTGSVTFATTGQKFIALTGAPITLAPGWYAAGSSTTSASPLLKLGCVGTSASQITMWNSAAVSNGSTLSPSSITTPAAAIAVNGNSLNIALY